MRRAPAPSRAAATGRKRAALLDEVLQGQRGERALAFFLQLGRDELHLAPAAVLRKLPACIDARDRDAEVDDAAEHALDILRAQRIELRQPLRIHGADQASHAGMLVAEVLDD